VPGVDIKESVVLNWAWKILDEPTRDFDYGEARDKMAVALPHFVPSVGPIAKPLLRAWANGDHPLACIRAACPARTPVGWLHPVELEELYEAVRSNASWTWRDQRRAVWRALVESGADPMPTWYALERWTPRTKELPTGQWVPEHLVKGLNGSDVATEGPESRDPLDVAIAQLVVDLPFHWAVLSAARIVEDETVETMAIGVTDKGRATLFYNLEFTNSISLEERMGVLTHEVNHLIFGHCEGVPTGSKGRQSVQSSDRDAWTLACECTANEFIPFPLPGDPFTIDMLKLPPDESTRKRYDRLRRRKELVTPPKCDALGHCVPEDATEHSQRALGLPETEPLLSRAMEDVGDDIDRATLERLQALRPDVDRQALRPSRSTQLPWTTLIHLTAKTIKDRAATRTFPNRRQPEMLGIVPGRRKRRGVAVVVIALDTSASMTIEELSEVSGEVRKLMGMGMKVGLVQCDHEIREERWFGAKDELTYVVGREGTDLRPPFDPRVLRKFRPDLIVYFTDGDGPAAKVGPSGVSVLWVLTGSDPVVPARWGRTVVMRPKRQRS
jgi:predicted metal-dependent peptidase